MKKEQSTKRKIGGEVVEVYHFESLFGACFYATAPFFLFSVFLSFIYFWFFVYTRCFFFFFLEKVLCFAISLLYLMVYYVKAYASFLRVMVDLLD